MEALPAGFLALIVLGFLYLGASQAAKQRWDGIAPLNPLKITAGPLGRASLSNLQVFFFSAIVLWLAIFWLFRKSGQLIEFHDSVLLLLGITAAGTGGAKIAEASTKRLSFENWAWLKKKKWIQRDITRNPVTRTPKLADLMTSDQGFEVARFQAVSFSIVIGVALLIWGVTGTAAEFKDIKIPAAYLILLGISQGVYVGGKAVVPSTIAELNGKLTKLRELELAYKTKVSSSAAWSATTGGTLTVETAKNEAPDEYTVYISAAEVAAVMVGEQTGNPIARPTYEPDLP